MNLCNLFSLSSVGMRPRSSLSNPVCPLSHPLPLSVYIPNVWKVLLTSIPFISIKVEGLQSEAWPILSRIDVTPYHGLLTVSCLMTDWWRGSQVGPG